MHIAFELVLFSQDKSREGGGYSKADPQTGKTDACDGSVNEPKWNLKYRSCIRPSRIYPSQWRR